MTYNKKFSTYSLRPVILVARLFLQFSPRHFPDQTRGPRLLSISSDAGRFGRPGPRRRLASLLPSRTAASFPSPPLAASFPFARRPRRFNFGDHRPQSTLSFRLCPSSTTSFPSTMKLAPPWTPSTRALGSTGAPSPIHRRCLPPAALRPTEPSFPEGGESELALPFVDLLLVVWLPRRPAATTTVHLAVNLIHYYRAKVRMLA